MARKPRFNLPGVPQHVVQRGNNREPCFFAEADYQRYKHDLQEAAERKKLDDEACGEIETAHPGYLGSQDTFYVGTFKGVGRVY